MSIKPLRCTRTRRVGFVARHGNLYLFSNTRDDATRSMARIAWRNGNG